MNELLWVGFALLDLILVLVVYRLFGRVGMYALITFNLIVCNVQVLKTIDLFGITTTLGNILYASVFLSTDILSEFHGKSHAKRGVLLGFVILVMTTIYMQLALRFIPGADDWVQPHLEAIFGFLPPRCCRQPRRLRLLPIPRYLGLSLLEGKKQAANTSGCATI